MKTTHLSITSVNIEDPEELARFREERDARLAQRKAVIVADLTLHGDLNEEGHWVFKKPLPADMQPDSPADFKH